MPFQTAEREPEAFAVVLVPLPDLGNERSLRRGAIEQRSKLGEVDLALADRQSFSIDALRIRNMEMRRVRADRRCELRPGPLEVVAGELRVGHVEADPIAVRLAERGDLVGVDEQVVITLAAK